MGTVYLDDHQELFLELHPEMTTSGVVRQAFDYWLQEAQDIDPCALDKAIESVRENSEADTVEQIAKGFAEDVYSADEFLNKVDEHDTVQIHE